MATKKTITLGELNLDVTYSVKDGSVRGCHTESGHNLKVGDMIVIDNYFHEIIETPTEPEKTPTEPEKPLTVSISKGNRKMGAIPSVSLPPIVTCPAGAPCVGKCYAAKMCRIYPSVKKAYQNNLDILNDNWCEYWQQVRTAVALNKYFRFHVSGDLPNEAYFKEVVITARQNPTTQILIFTKRYNIVNDFIAVYGDLPANLHLIMSEWGCQKPANPYNLPTAAVIFKGEVPADDWKVCGGNCTECACRGCGCWELKKGETIAFYEH